MSTNRNQGFELAHIQAKLKYLLVAGTIILLVTFFVLNASKPGMNIEGCLNGCASAGERAPGALRVLSLNMLHGFPTFKDLPLRVSLIVREVGRLDADIVLLQEVPWTIGTGNVAQGMAKQLGYNYIYYRANGNKNLILFEEGEAILSRFPLKEAVYTELLPRASFFDTRVALGAKAVTPWGEVSVFVSHITDSGAESAAPQIKSLQKFVDAQSHQEAVVGGDFNSTENSPQIIGLEKVWMDTYRMMHPRDQGLTCCIDNLKAGPGEALEERIDYIFLVNFTGKVIRAEHAIYSPFKVEGGWQWASDHTGLLVEIEP